jgi:hypothetical protein
VREGEEEGGGRGESKEKREGREEGEEGEGRGRRGGEGEGRERTGRVKGGRGIPVTPSSSPMEGCPPVVRPVEEDSIGLPSLLLLLPSLPTLPTLLLSLLSLLPPRSTSPSPSSTPGNIFPLRNSVEFQEFVEELVEPKAADDLEGDEAGVVGDVEFGGGGEEIEDAGNYFFAHFQVSFLGKDEKSRKSTLHSSPLLAPPLPSSLLSPLPLSFPSPSYSPLMDYSQLV